MWNRKVPPDTKFDIEKLGKCSSMSTWSLSGTLMTSTSMVIVASLNFDVLFEISTNFLPLYASLRVRSLESCEPHLKVRV